MVFLTPLIIVVVGPVNLNARAIYRYIWELFKRRCQQVIQRNGV